MADNNIVEIQFKPNVGYFKIYGREGRSRWDGHIISETKQCGACAFRRDVELKPYTKQLELSEQPLIESSEDRIAGVCTRGWAWKVLYKGEKKKKCAGWG